MSESCALFTSCPAEDQRSVEITGGDLVSPSDERIGADIEPARHHEPPCVQLRLDNLTQTAITVSLAPMVSMLSLVVDAARGRFATMSTKLQSTAQEILRFGDHDGVRPLVSGRSILPEVVVPLHPTRDIDVKEQLDCLRSVSEDALLADLDETYGADLPKAWQEVAARPSRWLSAYNRTMTNAWELFAPVWQSARSAIDRDIEKVAVAAARRQQRFLLGSLSTKVSLDHESMYFPDDEPAVRALSGRSLVLVPMLARSQALVTNFDQPDCVWIGYPIRTLSRIGARDYGVGTRTEDSLDIVLGQHRATILRSLDKPCNVGDLADAMFYAPTTLTYHCKLLVDAGLIARKRHGRQILLSRTERGSELLGLLGDE